MSATVLGKRMDRTTGRAGRPLVKVGQGLGDSSFSVVRLGKSVRISVMATPSGGGSIHQQLREALAQLHAALEQQTIRATVTAQTVFLRDAAERPECEKIMAAHYGSEQPVTTYVLEPPCSGAALALEAWALGGKEVKVERFGPQVLAVSYEGVRWISCSGIESPGQEPSVYRQTQRVLGQMAEALKTAGSDYEHVVRTWFYLGGITGSEGGTQRYKELNRARTDFYRPIHFCRSLLEPGIPHGVYPASTGIGMVGQGLAASCLALQTDRKDVFLLALENPQQTPAYAYSPRYSPDSPKFSRAMALLLGDFVTTWISGTASIVNSETRHLGDIEKQTEQTIDNIERLIAPENMAFHGVPGAGSRLSDVAKLRVYVKRPEDYARCKAVCERRFGAAPVIYALADVCRPELLVEIEGVAFSRRTTAAVVGPEGNGASDGK